MDHVLHGKMVKSIYVRYDHRHIYGKMIKIALVIKVTDFGFYFWRENSDNLSGFDDTLLVIF